MELAKVKMCLQILKAPYQVVLHVFRIENAILILGAYPQQTPEASSATTISPQPKRSY